MELNISRLGVVRARQANFSQRHTPCPVSCLALSPHLERCIAAEAVRTWPAGCFSFSIRTNQYRLLTRVLVKRGGSAVRRGQAGVQTETHLRFVLGRA